MALNPTLRPRLLPGLLRRYRLRHALAIPSHYVDKSHPNLWLAEALAEVFDDALFVGIVRNPCATVASMLRQEGVLGGRLHVVEYEALAREAGAELSRLADFLGLSSPIPSPEVKRDSLTRWREELGEAEREAIGAVVGGPESPGKHWMNGPPTPLT